MAARVCSTTLVGIDAAPIEIETQIFGSLRRFSMVGLPDSALRESKDRVRCAIENSGFSFSHNEVIVSLAPAALPKFGSGFDLGIALSILAADGVLNGDSLENTVVLGELALDGGVKPAQGAFAAAMLARERPGLRLIVPCANAAEAALVAGVSVFSVNSLRETVSFLNGELALEQIAPGKPRAAVRSTGDRALLGDVVGQHAAKRALEISAAGAHNLLMLGPPGAGKTMLAKRLPTILPPLGDGEALQVTKIYSALSADGHAARGYCPWLDRIRPFRAPHHTTSTAGLIGGGSNPLPGEISLAHCGVLFLDELTEFRRDVLEALRQPLESRKVLISRAKLRVSYPADFVLVAAMNPCPCGRRGSGQGICRCSAQAIARYQAKISGPLLDRIDLQVWVPAVPLSELTRSSEKDTTEEVAGRVRAAREQQAARFRSRRTNSQLNASQIKQSCTIEGAAAELLEKAGERFSLSARGYSRVLRVARTIADLEGEVKIGCAHLAEALSYRVPMQA